MYLGGRYALPINSNPALVLNPDPFHRTQVVRAASLIYGYTRWFAAMQRSGIQADFGGRTRDIPLCMREYQRLFAFTRIPFSGVDEPMITPESRHVVVMRGADLYTIDVLTERGDLVPRAKVRDAVAAILSGKCRQESSLKFVDTETATTDCAGVPLGCFTALKRPQWCEWRALLERESERNRQHLRTIETALFTVSLDRRQPTNPTQKFEACLHGCHIENKVCRHCVELTAWVGSVTNDLDGT